MPDASDKPFAEWIGRQTRSEDLITDRLDASFRAIFAPHLAPTGDGAAPLGIQWCLSPAIAPMAELGPDGHPALNRDMPPVPQPRRMWAGGLIETFAPLRVGDHVTRVSTIADITRKQGRSGELWFVSVNHDYSTPDGLAIRERQDIVYREAAKPGAARPAPAAGAAPTRPAAETWTLATTPTLLFRYSAITFNGHRIHYDLPYATGVEGYDGLVVHGPIQATLLFNLAAATGGGAPRRFSYRGVAPAVVGSDLTICRGAADEPNALWTHGPSGRVHMEASTGED